MGKNWQLFKGIIFIVFSLLLLGTLVYAAFSALNTVDRGEEICDEIFSVNVSGNHVYYTMDSYCCYKDDYRKEHCKRLNWEDYKE